MGSVNTCETCNWEANALKDPKASDSSCCCCCIKDESKVFSLLLFMCKLSAWLLQLCRWQNCVERGVCVISWNVSVNNIKFQRRDMATTTKRKPSTVFPLFTKAYQSILVTSMVRDKEEEKNMKKKRQREKHFD